MSKERSEAEKILSEYGRRLYDSHVSYFTDNSEPDQGITYRPVRARSARRIARRALILCAAMIFVLSLTVVVCSAMGLQIFNYQFDFKDGFIVITSHDDADGTHYYKPAYIVDGYEHEDTLTVGDMVIYSYVNQSTGEEYTIEEGTNKDAIIYIDNESYDTAKESYGGYEIVVHRSKTEPLIMVFMEKELTCISIAGDLSMDQIYSIIDSFVIDKDITK